MPIAWKGTLAQYVGRLNRNYESKAEVQVYDYVDVHVKVLERMYHKRLRGYSELGYAAKTGITDDKIGIIFDARSFFTTFSKDIEKADFEIFIISPFVRSARVIEILKLFTVPLVNNAKITIVTQPPEDYKLNDQSNISLMIDELRAVGVNVVTQSGVHQKYAVIDRFIVWYGSINFLAFGRSEESVMRFENPDIAGELLDASADSIVE